MLLPVADILLIERRRCQHCGKSYDSPGIFIHRLDSSPEGELSKKSMHSRRPLGHERGGDPHVELRAVRIFEVSVPFCQACWSPNISWQNANAILPDRPERQWSEPGQAFARTLSPRPLRNLPDTISAKDL